MLPEDGCICFILGAGMYPISSIDCSTRAGSLAALFSWSSAYAFLTSPSSRAIFFMCPSAAFFKFTNMSFKVLTNLKIAILRSFRRFPILTVIFTKVLKAISSCRFVSSAIFHIVCVVCVWCVVCGVWCVVCVYVWCA